MPEYTTSRSIDRVPFPNGSASEQNGSHIKPPWQDDAPWSLSTSSGGRPGPLPFWPT